MIVMRIELDNFLAFRDFSLNLSYPKRIVKSYISGEYISGCPNFRYKKLLVLMGANAAGKTSLGQMFNHVFNFMVRHQTEKIISSVCDKSREAKILLDFIPSGMKPELYRLELFLKSAQPGSEPGILSRVKKTNIRQTDSYEKACKRLDVQDKEYADYLYVFKELPSIGFFFSYPMDVMPDTVPTGGSAVYRAILEKVLRVLDAGITRVNVVPDAQNAYNIHMASGQNVLIQEGHVVDTSLLSSGTKAGIGIADMLSAMKEHRCGFYYCDERFSYVHSEVEKAVLAVMLELLGEGEQLIFTTHNMDMLSLPLPKHTYAFLKKTVTDSGIEITTVNASDYLKRNTDSLRKATENDMFSVFPDTEQIASIAYE